MKQQLLLYIYVLFATLTFGQNKTLVWSDEFNGSSINTSYWGFDLGNGEGGWGNQELQYYTDRSENARVASGNLIITAKKESFAGYNYTSARLVTRNKIAWKYGRIEVRANLPEGRGIWPAIWMLPEVWNYGNGSWPDNGEIDIMEYVGYKPGIVHASLHNHINYAGNSITQTIEIANVEDNFHVYALEWSEEKIEMFVDETKYFTYNNPGTGWEAWPWDKEFHLLINIAVGGTWGGAQGVDDAIFPQTMEIDYVKVYQLEGNEELIIESAKVDTNKVEINLDFNLDMATPQNENNNFEVLVNNLDVFTVDSVYIDLENNKRLKIRTEDAFEKGDVVSLSYTPGNIQSVSGTLLEAFQGKLVQNIITSNSVNIQNHSNAFYPNPFSENIFYSNHLDGLLEVFDITGKLIYTTHTSKTNYINTANWDTGLYLFRFRTWNNAIYTVKMLKSKY